MKTPIQTMLGWAAELETDAFEIASRRSLRPAAAPAADDFWTEAEAEWSDAPATAETRVDELAAVPMTELAATLGW